MEYSAKHIAQWLQAMAELRNDTTAFELDWYNAAVQVCPSEWVLPMYLLADQGHGELWAWVDEQLA